MTSLHWRNEWCMKLKSSPTSPWLSGVPNGPNRCGQTPISTSMRGCLLSSVRRGMNSFALHDCFTFIMSAKETEPYIANPKTKELFQNLYRYVKTITVLRSLLFAEVIDPETHKKEETRLIDLLERLKKNDLGKFSPAELLRFCELWGIREEYEQIDQKKHSKRVDVSVAIISSEIAHLNDEIVADADVGILLPILANFVHQLKLLRNRNSNLTPQMKYCIEELCQVEESLKTKHSEDHIGEAEQKHMLDLMKKLAVQIKHILNAGDS